MIKWSDIMSKEMEGWKDGRMRGSNEKMRRENEGI
jgi:hypothetical protein